MKAHIDRFSNRLRTLAFGVGAGHLITIVATPILTRIYTIEQFGVLAIYLASLQLARIVICLRYERAILIPRRDEDAVPILILAISISMLIATFIFFIIRSKSLCEVCDKYIHDGWIYIIPFSIVVVGFSQTLMQWLNRVDKCSLISQAKMLEAMITIIAQVILFEWELGLIYGVIAGLVVTNIMMLVAVIRSVSRLETVEIGFSSLKMVAVRYKSFPMVSMWAGMINALADRIPMFMVASLFGSQSAGFYGLCHRILSAPSALFGQGAVMALSKTAIDERKSGRGTKSAVEKSIKVLFLIGIIPFSIVTMFGEELFGILFGEEWKAAGIYAQLLAPMLFLRFIIFPALNILIIIERHDLLFVWTLIKIILISTGIYLSAIFFNNAEISIAVYSILNGMILILGMFWVLLVTGASIRSMIKS